MRSNSKGIVKNQRVSVVKVLRSRELRKSMTDAEKIFWEMVRGRKFHGLKFRRQQIIDGFIVDFYCNSLGLCVEIDGIVHNSDSQKLYDIIRDELLKRRGLSVLRFSNDEVLNEITSVKEKILDII